MIAQKKRHLKPNFNASRRYNSAKFSTDCFFDVNIKMIAFLTMNIIK